MLCLLFVYHGWLLFWYCQVLPSDLAGNSWNHVLGGKSYGIQTSNNKKSLIRNIQFYLPAVLPQHPPTTSPPYTDLTNSLPLYSLQQLQDVFSTFSPVLYYNLSRIFMWVLVTWHDDKLCNRIVTNVTKTQWLLSLWWISTDMQQGKWRLYLVLASITDQQDVY